MSKRKICIVSATRAEWYLLRNLCKEIKNDEDLELQIIVSGAHLSVEFGLTYKDIEKEFNINKKIPILLASDDKISLCKAMGLANISFCEAFDELEPDIVVILGDRYEMLSVASVCLMMNIPIAHLCGGELTLGAIDDSIRHSISKMAHLHFVSHEIYKKRVMQLGENQERIFNIGSLGGENITKMQLLSKNEISLELGFDYKKDIYLIVFHPETLNLEQSANEIIFLLDFLDNLGEANLVFTKANADANGILINEKIQEFCNKNSHKAKLFDNLGARRFLSVMKNAKAMIGNSSSGICESPFFKTPCINIGDRQKGRIRAKNIIDCDIYDIKKAFSRLNSKEYLKELENFKNPFYADNPSQKIKNTIKKANLDTILNKDFVDL